MKIIVAPGAFKHSLSANQAAETMARGLEDSGLNATIHKLPIADGGNGTLDAFLANGGQRVEVEVLDPLRRPVKAAFGLLPDGKTAVIEMALASGLELLATSELNPLQATTYGAGQLMQAALDHGARRFIVGMGGSATVDGGAGCVQALGVRLMDSAGHAIPPGGGGLAQLAEIDARGLDPRWDDVVEIIIASDVENPTLGETGAAAVFGPQKGASPQEVEILEANLRHFFTLTAAQTGTDVRELVGGGAAGALSAGIIAYVGGRIESGIDLILAHHDFDGLVRDADLVVTGEGQIDEQTIYGKGPIGVARRAAAYGVPTIAIVGGLNADDAMLHEAGIQAVLPIVTGPMSLEDAIRDAESLVERAALRLGYVLRVKSRTSKEKMESLTDKEVLELSKSRMDETQNKRLSVLLEKQQAGTIHAEEKVELEILMQIYQDGSLQKAQALAEAIRRGLRKPSDP